MENTIENKAKFFALYYGQKVAKSELHNDKLPCCKSFAELALKPENKFFLVLKDLSKISNEDAIEVAQLCSNYFPFNDDIECEIFQNLHGRKVVSWGNSYKEKFLIEDAINITNGADFLRSKGYLIPFMGLSTEKIIEYGWVQIKS